MKGRTIARAAGAGAGAMLPLMPDAPAPVRTALAIAADVAGGRTRAREEIDAALARAEAAQARTNAFTHLLHARARAAADALDAARAAGETLPPLSGVPFVVKANLCLEGAPTTAASAILAGFVPPYTATVVARLEAAGAVPIAMANMDEFGMGGSSEASAHGPVLHPADPERVAGGSSGGSAAAVAAGVVPFALGTDTGGSVRQPAAFCGLIGFKPTYGTLSRYGVIAYASSLDQVGVLAHDVRDVAAVVDLMRGPDPHDATTVEAPSTAAELDAPLTGLRVGVVPELAGEGNHAAVRAGMDATVARLRELGAEVRPASLPSSRAGVACYYLIASAEASSNLARYDGTITGARVGEESDGQVEVATATRGAGFGTEVRRRVLMGTFVSSAGHVDAWYGQALRVRRKIADEMDAAFEDVDLLLTPTAPGPAFRQGERIDDPLAMYLGDVDTCLANLAGVGAVSVPAGRDERGLPVGAQLLAPALHDATLLRVAAALSRS